MIAIYETKLKLDNEMLQNVLKIMRKLQIRNLRISFEDYTELRVECYQDIKMILKELVDNFYLHDNYFSHIKVLDDKGKIHEFGTIRHFLQTDIPEIRGINAI